MNFSGVPDEVINELIQEAKSQLEQILNLEGGQQTDLRDFIAAAEAELARRNNGCLIVNEIAKAL